MILSFSFFIQLRKSIFYTKCSYILTDKMLVWLCKFTVGFRDRTYFHVALCSPDPMHQIKFIACKKQNIGHRNAARCKAEHRDTTAGLYDFSVLRTRLVPSRQSHAKSWTLSKRNIIGNGTTATRLHLKRVERDRFFSCGTGIDRQNTIENAIANRADLFPSYKNEHRNIARDRNRIIRAVPLR